MASTNGQIILVVAIGWFIQSGIRVIYPVLLPNLQDAYGISLAIAGLLLSALGMARALGQLPGGVLGEIIGERNTLMISVLVAAFAITSLIVVKSIFVLFIATIVFGFASSLFGIVRYSITVYAYPNQIGTAIGFIAGVGTFGRAIIPPIAGGIAAVASWEAGFGFVIPLLLGLSVIVWFIIPTRATEKSENSVISFDSVNFVISEIRRKRIFLIVLLQTIGQGLSRALTGFFPTYLILNKSISPTVASILFAIFFGLGFVVKPLFGRIYDDRGVKFSFYIVLIGTAVSLIFLVFASGVWTLALVTIIASVIHGRGTVAMSYITDSLSDEMLNTSIGTLKTFFSAIASMSPFLFGLIAERGYFDEGFLLLGIISLVAIPVVSMLPEPNG